MQDKQEVSDAPLQDLQVELQKAHALRMTS
jgi:hypothetical protein